MLNRSHRSVTSLLAAAAAFASSAGVISAAHASEALLEPGFTRTAGEASLDRAAALIGENKVVHARAMLLEVMQGGGAALADADRARGFELLTQATRRVGQLSPTERSLQHADMALAQSDLLAARRHVDAVLAGSAVDGPTLLRAETLKDRIDTRQREIEALIAPRLIQAERSLAEGDVATAKQTLVWIVRTGVELTEAQRARLTTAQLAVLDLEQLGTATRGETLSLAVQPGVVERGQPQVQEPDPIDNVLDDTARQEALRLLEEARLLREERSLSQALTRLQRVDAQFRDALTAQERQSLDRQLLDIRAELDLETSGPGGDITDIVRSQREIARQEFRTAFDALLARARSDLDEGDIAGARDALAQARLRLADARTLIDEGEFESRDDLAAVVAAEIEDQANRRAEQLAREAASAAAAREAEARQREAAERRRKIDEAILRVRDLQVNRRYGEALQVVEQQILFLDPNNSAGQLLRDIIRDTMIFDEYRMIRAQKQENVAELTLDNFAASIPPTNIIEFPPDWPSISFARTSPIASAGESPENRAVLAKLERERVPTVSFSNNTLAEALGFFEAITQLNMDVDYEALAEVNISRDDTLTLNLRNVTYETLLDRILARVSNEDFNEKASWAVNDGVLVVSSDQEIRRNTTLEIYDISDLVVEIPDYTSAPEFDLNSILQNSGGGGGGGGGQSPFQEEEDDDVARRPLQERIDELKELIRDNVDPEGWVDRAGDTGSIQDWQRQLIITNTPANHREIRGLLSRLREIRAVQVSVEARFLLVNSDFFEEIGFDLDVYFNANNNQVRAAQATDPAIQAGDFFNFAQGNGLQRRVTSPNGTTVDVVNPDDVSVIGAPQNSLGLTQGLLGSLVPTDGIASTILGAAPALGVSGQFLDDVQVDFLIQATQADTRSVTLQAPRITFTNGRGANIFVSTQTGFVSDLQPIVSDSAVGFDPTVATLNEGVRLVIFQGVASADRRYVSLDIDASIAALEGFQQQAVTAVAGGQLVNSADTASFIQIPQLTVTRVQTFVTVPDQGTIMLGGQRVMNEYEVETGVPVLSKIPILNRFFSNRIISQDESTLLILAKPTLLIQGEQEEQAFPGVNEAIRGLR